MPTFVRNIRYALWTLNGYMGKKWSLDFPEKVTILITYYSSVRMKHIDSQIRNLLKCDFVAKIVLSNHNPDVQIEEQVKIRDERLIFMNQNIRRGCGYRWFIANDLDPEYLIVIDDDLLLFPWQVAKLFKHLVSEPDVPHGITGMLHLNNNSFEYREKEERTVDFLCEIYAVTRKHLHRYTELRSLIAKNDNLIEMIDSAADFMIISRTGSDKAQIHNMGRLLRCTSFKEAGVAVHKEKDFDESLLEVSHALSNGSVQDREQPIDAVPI